MVGSNVKVRGPPLTVEPCAALAVHVMLTGLPASVTSSLNVISTFALSGTWVAPFDGLVAVTLGAASTGGPPQGVPPFELPGVAGPSVKSTAFWSVSQPSGTAADAHVRRGVVVGGRSRGALEVARHLTLVGHRIDDRAADDDRHRIRVDPFWIRSLFAPKSRSHSGTVA